MKLLIIYENGQGKGKYDEVIVKIITNGRCDKRLEGGTRYPVAERKCIDPDVA